MGALAAMISKFLGSGMSNVGGNGMSLPMIGGGSSGAMPTSPPVSGSKPSMGSMLGSMSFGGGGGGKAVGTQIAMQHANAANKDMSETPNGQALFQMFTQLAQQQPNWNRQFVQPNEYVRFLMQRGL